METTVRILPASSNQARGIAQYAIDFCRHRRGEVASEVWQRLELFHLDSVACAVSALAAGCNAPRVLRDEALEYPDPNGVFCFGSTTPVAAEKAVLANCSAVREWDANGTNFGFNPRWEATEGEFGHNDFYPVAVAAAQRAGLDGETLRRAMLCVDEIRGRLAERFALRKYAIDHVLHGAIASAAVYGALVGADVDQIESAIGLVVSHYVPFRAIRAGMQLSDSKGASAAISAEAAVMCVHRAMRGFRGPADVFRNPKAIFCLNELPPQPGSSPFMLQLAESGRDFAIMDMHFKLGLYEHQSAGAIHGLLELLERHPKLLEPAHRPASLEVVLYEPAVSIIGDPAKCRPTTRQSADHSLFFILARLLQKAFERKTADWKSLMLMPDDYADERLADPQIHQWIDRIRLVHGGAEYDRLYPEGIPTSIRWTTEVGEVLSSGLVQFPKGHAKNTDRDVPELLAEKFNRLVRNAGIDPSELRRRLSAIEDKTPTEIRNLYVIEIVR